MHTGRLRQKLAKFRSLHRADKWMLIHATMWLALARLMLIILSFRRLASRLLRTESTGQKAPDPEFIERIGYAVRTAAANVPWRSDCFPQSIAGWMLLKHHGYCSTIHLGVARTGDDGLAWHSWLTCGDTVVTGGEDLDRYAETHRLGA
jgi:hypothetical protein